MVDAEDWTLRSSSRYEGKYVGEWQNGQPEGQGTFTTNDELWKYEGSYIIPFFVY